MFALEKERVLSETYLLKNMQTKLNIMDETRFQFFWN